MMMVYRVMYKCRMCGKIFANGTMPSKYSLADIIGNMFAPPNGVQFHMVSFHQCLGAEEWGVADLIGVIGMVTHERETDDSR